MRIERIDRIGVDRYFFIQIHTDAGISGIGECGLWAYPAANDAIVRAWEPYLIGQDPLLIEHHWNYLYRNSHFRGGAISGALGAIDMALWDIFGKRYELPVSQLLGGRTRNKVRIQTQVDSPTIEEVVAKSRREAARGITALRINPIMPGFENMSHDQMIGTAVECVGAMREAIGKDVDIGIEIHRRISPADAIVLAAALEQFRPMYFEDPIVQESTASYGDIARQIRLPMATGERLQTLYEFRELLVCGGARYARIDVGLVGGISAAKKVAALAEAFHVGVIPHGALSTVGTAAAIQLDASIPNFTVQDYMAIEEPPNSEMLVEPLRVENGYAIVPEQPGIGAVLKPGIEKTYPFTPLPFKTLLRQDGSVADR